MGALVGVMVKSGRTCVARSRNRDTASDWRSTVIGSLGVLAGSDIDGTRHAVSPSTPSGARLVARTVTDGQLRTSMSASCAQAVTRCSQLSRMSSVWRVCR